MRVMTKNQKGQALLATIVGISLVLLMLLTTLTITEYSGKLLARQLTYQGQALNAAQAGLTEGRSWFVRQSTQPVVNFAPLRNTAGVPPIDDTESQATGLVRNYLISGPGRIWARYELDATGVAGTQTVDLTARRGKKVSASGAGAGLIWQLESQGAIYVNNNPAVAYNVSPNQVLARRTLRSEIQRLGMNLPADAALLVSRSDRVTLQNASVEINGGNSTAIAWPNFPASGGPTGSVTALTVIGNPDTSSGLLPAAAVVPSFSIPSVFGITLPELVNMASFQVTSVAGLALLPNPLPPMSLIILNSPGNTFTFNAAQPLTGSGILVVLGNLTIAANSNSSFDGLIYVQGSFSMSQPSTINGSVLVTDAVAPATVPTAGTRTVIFSGAGEKPVIRYDRGLLNFVAQRMGLYNTTRNPYIPCAVGSICD